MPASVTTITPELVKRLRDHKILAEASSDVQLEAVAGAEILGTLTADEIAIFTEVVHLDYWLIDAIKEINIAATEAVIHAVRRTENIGEMLNYLQNHAIFENTTDAEEYFSHCSRLDYLRAILFYGLRERLNCWGANLQIRAGFTVCKIGLKYKV